MIRRLATWLQGKKTHLAAVGTVVSVLWLYRHNLATDAEVTQAVGTALCLMFLRKGVASVQNPKPAIQNDAGPAGAKPPEDAAENSHSARLPEPGPVPASNRWTKVVIS